MNSITQNNRYLPHELNTKFYAVKLYRNGNSISFVCRRYKISKSSPKKFSETTEIPNIFAIGGCTKNSSKRKITDAINTIIKRHALEKIEEEN